MELETRRRVGIIIRILLVIATFAFVGRWFVSRIPKAPDNVSVTREAPSPSQLGPGDIQIVSTDGKIDLILKGDKIMGGLSPATVARVRAEMDKGKTDDSTGFGAMISGMVKSSVASAIGTHVTYPVSEVTEVRFDDGKLVVKTVKGGEKENNFGDINVNDDKGPRNKDGARFSKADGDRFVAAFKARRKELGLPE